MSLTSINRIARCLNRSTLYIAEQSSNWRIWWKLLKRFDDMAQVVFRGLNNSSAPGRLPKTAILMGDINDDPPNLGCFRCFPKCSIKTGKPAPSSRRCVAPAELGSAPPHSPPLAAQRPWPPRHLAAQKMALDSHGVLITPLPKELIVWLGQ